jgi:ribosomal protein S4
MVLKPGAILEVGRRQKSRDLARQSLEQSEGRGVSPWLSLDKEALRGEVLHTPSREEIAPFVKEHLVVELYSK